MTVEEFEQQLSRLGEELQDSDAILLDIVGPLLENMKRRAPYATGKLQSSIGAIVNNGTIKFNMLYYGAYQNYGVSGTEDSLGTPVQFGVDQRPSNGTNYEFQNRRFGIPRTQFFDVESMTNYIVTEYENRIADNG